MNRMPAAFAALLLCGSLAACVGPHRTDAQRDEDRDTANRVQLALNSTRGLYANHITVNVNRGVVDLGGYVWEREDLQEAVRVAGAVPGVARVVNDLELERNGVDDSPVSR
jgi:osmotically-inducible protein OsmY